MDEIAFLRFSDQRRYLLTDDLNGCFAIFLMSPIAGIGAHISPNPGLDRNDARAGDRHLMKMMEDSRDKL